MGSRMYFRKAEEFQRPKRWIWAGGVLRIAAWVAAPIRKEWDLKRDGSRFMAFRQDWR